MRVDHQLKQLGFDLDSIAFQSSWNNDPLFRSGIESGMTITDICIMLSNQRMIDQKRHVDYISQCICQVENNLVAINPKQKES